MNTNAPALPFAPAEYSREYQDQLNRILAQYFSKLDNPGIVKGSAANVGTTKVIAALNFSRPNAAGVMTASFPTQADLANLRVGDVYVDTASGNVLKLKM